MSFSGKVKEEIGRKISRSRHCQIAEIAAILGMCGTLVKNQPDQYKIKIQTENVVVARKVFTLIEKTFNIKTDISIRRNISKHRVLYCMAVGNHEDALRILQALKVVDEHRVQTGILQTVNPIVTRQTC